MVEIMNKQNQRLIINLKSGTIDLLARSTTAVSDNDLSSSHLQNLLGSGKVIIVSRKEEKPKSKWQPKKVEIIKEEVTEPEENTISKESENIETVDSGYSETGEKIEPEESVEESPGNEPEEAQEQESKKRQSMKERKKR